MPIYLPAPEPNPRGPDGLGWNRKQSPTSGLLVLHDIHLAGAAPRLRRRQGGWCACGKRLVGTGFATEAHDTPYVMEDPDRGWDSPHQQWEWEELARLKDWRVGRAFHDQCSRGVWLERMPPGSKRRSAVRVSRHCFLCTSENEESHQQWHIRRVRPAPVTVVIRMPSGSA